MRLNPRQIERAMKKMGIKTDQIDADEVIIKTNSGKEIVISNPQVTKVNMSGQDTFQIAGDVSERESGEREESEGGEGAGAEEGPSEEDVNVVMQRTGATEAKARAALEESGNDLAQAIIKLKTKKKG